MNENFKHFLFKLVDPLITVFKIDNMWVGENVE